MPAHAPKVRAARGCLRTAAEPMTVAQIGSAVMLRLGMAEDRGALEFPESSVDGAIWRQQDQGLAETVAYGPHAVAWRVAAMQG